MFSMTELDLHSIQYLDGLTLAGQHEIDLNHNLARALLQKSANLVSGKQEQEDGAQLDHDIGRLDESVSLLRVRGLQPSRNQRGKATWEDPVTC